MIPATDRRCYGGGVKFGNTFSKSGAPWYRPHTGGALRGGGVGEDWGHLSQPMCPMIMATHRRCYGEGGMKIGAPFASQVTHVTGHTQAVLLRGGCEDWGHLSQSRCPMIMATHMGWRLGTPFPSQASHDTGHTQSMVWGEWWRLGTLFPSQASNDTGHTQAVVNGGGGGWRLGTPFRRQAPMIPATNRRCYGKPFSSQVSHVTGHTQATLCEGGGED